MNIKKKQELSLLSKLSFITRESTSNSDIKFIFNQESLKSTLKNLIMKYTNEAVIESIFCCIDNERKKKKKKLNSELDSVLYKIYQKFGPLKLFQTISSLKENDKVNELNNFDEEFNINNEVKIISLASTSEDEVFLDINNDENNTRYHLSNEINEENNNNNSNKKLKENVIIDINDNYQDKIIDLREEEEIEEEEHNSNNYLDKYPDQNIKKLKKRKNKFKPSDIWYHCSLIKGIYYKYKKLETVSSQNNQIIFKCYNRKCKSYGIYDTIDKTFMLKEPHWTGSTYLCYKDLMTEQDLNNYNYMRNNHVYEIQMYRDKKE